MDCGHRDQRQDKLSAQVDCARVCRVVLQDTLPPAVLGAPGVITVRRSQQPETRLPVEAGFVSPSSPSPPQPRGRSGGCCLHCTVFQISLPRPCTCSHPTPAGCYAIIAAVPPAWPDGCPPPSPRRHKPPGTCICKYCTTLLDLGELIVPTTCSKLLHRYSNTLKPVLVDL